MIAVLYRSCADGTNAFRIKGVSFRWQRIVKVYKSDLYRAQHCINRCVPGLKYAHVVRDSWTRLNVLLLHLQRIWMPATRYLKEEHCPTVKLPISRALL